MFDIFTREGLISFLYFLPALLLSLSIHEFGHAIVAYKLGDKSQKVRGRLNLSPFSHIDWLGFVSIALFGFGWGKPVMVDDTNFKKRGRDNMLVALAGPGFNLVLAFVITIILKLLLLTRLYGRMIENSIGSIIAEMLLLMVQFNVVFAVFNLIPLPPFDGSKVLYYFLPYNFKKWMDNLERYSIWVILILFVTPLSDYLIMPAYSFVLTILNFILVL